MWFSRRIYHGTKAPPTWFLLGTRGVPALNCAVVSDNLDRARTLLSLLRSPHVWLGPAVFSCHEMLKFI